MPTSKTENTPTRVVFVISALHRGGGAESHLVHLVSNLDRSRFQPSICILHTGTLIKEVPEDVPVFANLAIWAGDIRVLPKLVRFFRTQSPTIVDTLGRDDGALWGRLAARLTGVPIIIQSLHRGRFSASEDPKYTLYHILNRLLDPYTDAFVAVSQSQRAFYAKMGLPKDRIAVIYNGVDVDRFNPGKAAHMAARHKLGLPLQAPVVGMVANFSPIKRHDVLLQALSRMREKMPDVRCLLVGDGDLLVPMEKLVQQLELSGVVSFLGPRSDVSDLLPAIDVFVLTSDSESFSIAIVEAMASGKPVVATNCGGPGEIVIDGETGFLVPPGQPSALAEKLILLLQNPNLARQMGQVARHRAVKCFSLQVMIAAREILFLDLLNGKGLAQ